MKKSKNDTVSYYLTLCMFHILMNDIYTGYKHGNSNDPKNFKTGWNENGNETKF